MKRFLQIDMFSLPQFSMLLTMRRTLALGFGLIAVSLPAQSPWSLRDAGTTANLWGVAYRPQQTGSESPSGLAVVVGDQGVIITSGDEGATWTRRISGTTAWLTAVIYDSQLNLFFAVGDSGTILSSADGIAWTREVSPTSIRLNGATIGTAGNTVIAVGEPGAGLLTRDASGKWTQSDPGFGNRWMRGVLPSGEAAVGQGGASFNVQRNDPANPPNVTWQPAPAPVTSDLEAVTLGAFFQGPAPVAVGADGTILQGRGATWVARNSGTTQRLRGVCWKEGGFVRLVTLIYTISMGEFFAVGTGGTILRSADGVSWAAEIAPTQSHLNAVGATRNYVIAVGDGGTLLRTGGSPAQPSIIQGPVTGTDASGQVFAQAATAGEGQLTFLWVQLSGGAPYPVGSTFPRQLLAPAPFGLLGSPFQLLVGNAFGISRSATFTPNRFLNLAGRAIVGAGDNVFIGGFSVAGNSLQPRTMLIRAIGPGLTNLGVANALKAPRLSIFAGSQVLASNAGWESNGNPTELRDAERRSGAFPLAAGSADCALLLIAGPGNFTAQVESADGSTGVALVEIYDSEPPNLTRLKNLSARARVQGGEGALIGGLVIAGGAKKSVLLRAAGPALATFGLQAALAQPKLTLFKDGVVVAMAEKWGAAANAVQISAAAKLVSAFPFPDGSMDSAMLLELDPGAYSVQVTGADGSTGTALVEVYEVPVGGS